MLGQLRQSLLEQSCEDTLIYEHSVEAGEVVQRKVLFNDLAKRPEGLFFVHAKKQLACQKVHSLKVTDFRVAFHECVEDVGESLFLFLPALLVLHFLVRANHIFLNLPYIWRRIINTHFADSIIIASIRIHHREGA